MKKTLPPRRFVLPWRLPVPGLLVVALLSAFFAACESAPPEPAGRLSVELDSQQLPFPEWRILRFNWEPLSVPAHTGDLLTFVHLWNGSGELVRTFDHPFPEAWRPGETVTYETHLFQSALAPPLPPGDYALTAGLYTPEGERWPLEVEGEEMRRREYRIATLEVPPVGAELPVFTFPGPWGPPEPGADLQVLSRRWLEDNGRLEIANLGVPASLWLRLNVPPPEDEGWRLATLEEGQEPVLEVTSLCSGNSQRFERPGIHHLVLPVYGTNEAAECPVDFHANYFLLNVETLERRVVAVEVLSLTPAVL